MERIHPGARRVGVGHAFLLGALLALLSLLPAILPYGGRYVTRGDYIEQQIALILETRRILRSGLDSYSFSTFLGAPAVGSYAFYTLGSPFVWPLALLPQALIPYGISVMAVLKHAVAAAASFAYFRQLLRDGRLALLGSVLYTFSSFTVVNTQFYHFTEVIAFFPLILLGLEIAMSDRPRPGLLALCCGLNALTNYYFMLGSALLTALYFVCRFFSADWRGARSVRRVVCVVFECGVGCALAGVLLLPALMYMLTITRTGGGLVSVARAYSPAVLLERLRALLMPIESNVVHAFYGDAGSWCSTAAYLPVFGMTGAVVFAFAQRTQRWLKALVLALLAASAVPVLCGAFSLFTNVIYTRWWYGLSLMLALATLYALRGVRSRRPWLIAFTACALLTAVLTVPMLLPERVLACLPERLSQIIVHRRTRAYAGDVFRVLAVSLSLLGAGAMLLLILRRPRFVPAMCAVCLVACVQYGAYIAVGDASLRSGSEDPGSGPYTLRQLAEPTLSALSLDETQDYKRIDYGPMLRNYGLIRGASSLTCFHSLRTSYIGRFVGIAGFGYDESPTVCPPGDDGAIRALLSVTEYHRFTEDDAVPEGFEYSHEENGFAVYTNPNAVPMGFLQTVCTGTHHQRMDSETVGTVMLAAVTLGDDDLARYGDRLTRLDVQQIPDWQESAARLQLQACDRFETRADGFSAHIIAEEAGIVVFTIPFDKGFSAVVDGQRADIILCDAAFMGVFVEPGEHEIIFTYRTRMLRPGIAMSLLAAAALGIYVWLARKRMPRK